MPPCMATWSSVRVIVVDFAGCGVDIMARTLSWMALHLNGMTSVRSQASI